MTPFCLVGCVCQSVLWSPAPVCSRDMGEHLGQRRQRRGPLSLQRSLTGFHLRGQICFAAKIRVTSSLAVACEVGYSLSFISSWCQGRRKIMSFLQQPSKDMWVGLFLPFQDTVIPSAEGHQQCLSATGQHLCKVLSRAEFVFLRKRACAGGKEQQKRRE